VPIHDHFGEAQDDGSTPDPSLAPHTDNDNSVMASESSMTSYLSQKSDDDSSISSSCTASRCCTQRNNQIDSTTAMELQDLHDLKFLHNSVVALRDDRWEFNRLNWDEHVTQLEHEGLFTNEYLMSQSAHKKLVRILDPFLQRFEYNSRGPEPILVEHIIAVGLRVLSGGRPKDQRHIIGSSRAAAYLAVDDFVDAVNLAPELNIDLPTTPEEWEEIYEQYKMKSSSEIMAGCVGAIDGFFQRTNKPTSKEVGNVIAYYSGHYESYGLNCQACVRADLQFMYFGVISPGSTNDNISFPNATALKNAFDSLPLGRFGVADAAYTLSEGILVPFTGSARLDPAHDAFNYYLSQLRIRVEMAFGRLSNKFRILNGTIVGSQDRASSILIACARLHNFIIREDKPFGDNLECFPNDFADLEDVTANPIAPLGMSYLPVVPNEEFHRYDGISRTREAIVEVIREQDIRRPMHNLDRKRREMAGNTVYSPDGSEWTREFISPL
jgi:hypothetical protein